MLKCQYAGGRGLRNEISVDFKGFISCSLNLQMNMGEFGLVMDVRESMT